MYVKVIGGTASLYSLGQLKLDNPNVSFPAVIPEATLASYDTFPYVDAAVPAYDEATQNIALGAVLDSGGGNWVREWDITAKTAQEQTDYTKNQDREADLAALKADSQVATVLKKRPGEINSYIEANVTNLTEAKEVLKIYGRALAVLAHTTIN